MMSGKPLRFFCLFLLVFKTVVLYKIIIIKTVVCCYIVKHYLIFCQKMLEIARSNFEGKRRVSRIKMWCLWILIWSEPFKIFIYIHLQLLTISLMSDLHRSRYKFVLKLSDSQVWWDSVTAQWVRALHMAGQICDSSAGGRGQASHQRLLTDRWWLQGPERDPVENDQGRHLVSGLHIQWDICASVPMGMCTHTSYTYAYI